MSTATEDAVQEALLGAATQWPDDGVPDNPVAWLIIVATRRLTDLLRSEQARRQREDKVARRVLPDVWFSPAADRVEAPADDTLILLFMCCHPALTPESQIALTLTDNPVVALNHAVAVAMSDGAAAGLTLLEGVAADPRLADDHRLLAVRALLQEMTGDATSARDTYRAAAQLALSLPQQRYLNARATRLGEKSDD